MTPSSSEYPVFYDPRQRRRPLVMTVLLALALALGTAAALFGASLLTAPLLPAIRLPRPRLSVDAEANWPPQPPPNPANRVLNAVAARRELARRRAQAARAKQALREQIRGEDAHPVVHTPAPAP